SWTLGGGVDTMAPPRPMVRTPDAVYWRSSLSSDAAQAAKNPGKKDVASGCGSSGFSLSPSVSLRSSLGSAAPVLGEQGRGVGVAARPKAHCTLVPTTESGL